VRGSEVELWCGSEVECGVRKVRVAFATKLV
jgi:hypothetical protein